MKNDGSNRGKRHVNSTITQDDIHIYISQTISGRMMSYRNIWTATSHKTFMKQYSSNSYIFLINIFHHNQYQKILKSDKTNFRCNSKYCLKIHMQSKRKKSADQISFSIFHDNLSINVLLFTTQSMI